MHSRQHEDITNYYLKNINLRMIYEARDSKHPTKTFGTHTKQLSMRLLSDLGLLAPSKLFPSNKFVVIGFRHKMKFVKAIILGLIQLTSK